MVLLAGRSWRITNIDRKRRFAWVEPTEARGRSRWMGSGPPWSAELCAAIRSVICGAYPEDVVLTQRAQDMLAETRSDVTWARPGATSVVRGESTARWWTWAGQRANATLSDALGDLRGEGRGDNLAIAIEPNRGSTQSIRQWLADLNVEALPMPSAAVEFADGRKFSECLPADSAVSVAVARLLDPAALRRVLAELAMVELEGTDVS